MANARAYRLWADHLNRNLIKLNEAGEKRIGKVWDIKDDQEKKKWDTRDKFEKQWEDFDEQYGQFKNKVITEDIHEAVLLYYMISDFHSQIDRGVMETSNADGSINKFISGTTIQFDFKESIESVLDIVNFRSARLKQAFICFAIAFSDNNKASIRGVIRNLLNRNFQHIDDVLDLVYALENVKSHEFSLKKETLKDIKKIKNTDEYLTVYRGFNTKKDESIRYSKNKKKADYYRQVEGMGFSFTLDKYVAFCFGVFFQLRMLRVGGSFFQSYTKLLGNVDKQRKWIGHATVGRYVIHKDHIKGYNNTGYEREIVCDYRDAKLIDYKFISDINFNSKSLFNLDTNIYKSHDVIKKEIRKDKSNWINKHWNKDYKVSKEQDKVFSKTKK
jgi:hypothetical protein